jgi:Ca2+-binding RTX toxin-like protein/lysophospholipase L1-like esterase
MRHVAAPVVGVGLRAWVAGLLGLTAIAALAAAPGAAADPVDVERWSLGDACPDVLVVGARGSGQEDGQGGYAGDSPTLGLGAEVHGFTRHLAGRLTGDGLSIAAWPNPYPAVPVSEAISGDPDYFESVDAGKANTTLVVAVVAEQCGDATRIVLVGYSQGADVARRGAGFVDPDDEASIAALVLIADPQHDPDAGGYRVGGAPSDKGGIIGREAPPDWLRDRTTHVCVDHDLVCQSDTFGDLVEGWLVHGGDVIHANAYRDPVIQALTATLVEPIVRAAAVGGTCGGQPATVVGTAGDDVLAGTDGDDVIVGGAGADEILARGGGDVVCPAGGDGQPADAAADRVDAGDGNDYVLRADGPTYVDAGAGDDIVETGDGADEVHGAAGRDYLDAGPGNDELHGGAGDDHLVAGVGDDSLVAGPDVDYLDGGPGADDLEGSGGSGELGRGDFYDGGDGDDVLRGSADWEYLGAGPGDDEIDGGGGVDAFGNGDYLDGGDGNDVLRAGEDAEYLDGGDGDDELRGAGGDDYLAAGPGADDLTGGAGVDFFDAGDGDDSLRARDRAADSSLDCGVGSDAAAIDQVEDAELDGASCEQIDARKPGDTNGDDRVRVAVLGDSYISGVGAVDPGEPYDAGTDTPGNRCRRTGHSWGPKVAARLGATGDELLFAACGGATSLDVTSRGQQAQSAPGVHGSQPQTTTLRDWADAVPADVVLLSVGGNDVGFANLVGDCLMGPCLWFAEDRLEDQAFRARYRLADTYRAVVETATATNTAAELWVATYPDPLSGDLCDQVGYFPGLGWVTGSGIDAKEQAFLSDRFLETLNESIAWAAAAAGAHVVDLSEIADGNELCSETPYFNGVSPGFQGDGPWVASARTAHPNKAGHSHIDEEVWSVHGTAFGEGARSASGGSGEPPPLVGSMRLGPDPVDLQDTAPADVLFQPGGTVQLRVVDTPPGDYRLVVRSLPIVLGTLTVPASGGLDASFEIPGWLAPHSHWLTLESSAGVPVASAILQVGSPPGCDLGADDPDVDGDRLPDRCDKVADDGPLADADGDGVANVEDSCVLVADASRADADGDGLGDACDPDEGADPTAGYRLPSAEPDPPTCACGKRSKCPRPVRARGHGWHGPVCCADTAARRHERHHSKPPCKGKPPRGKGHGAHDHYRHVDRRRHAHRRGRVHDRGRSHHRGHAHHHRHGHRQPGRAGPRR